MNQTIHTTLGHGSVNRRGNQNCTEKLPSRTQTHPHTLGGLGWSGGDRRARAVAVAVAMVVRLWSFDVWARESWSGAVSTVSVLHSAFKRTKVRHLNRPQCKVMLILVMAPNGPPKNHQPDRETQAGGR